MSADRDQMGESFFSRWSRLKHAPAQDADAPPIETQAAAPATDAQSEAPPLPPVEELTIDSDFRGFLHPKVDDDVRRAALRKLFTDPHFNVMDGLDVYIDDYSKPDPIPPEMLAGLRHAQQIMKWAAEKKDGTTDADAETINAREPTEESGAEVAALPAAATQAGPAHDYATESGRETAPVPASREARPD